MRLDLSRRTDGELLREFSALVENDRRSTSHLLVYVGEIDARKLYRPAGYSSMYSYCVHAMHMSEDMAYKRIQAARASRRFPVILDMVADGRLHLTTVVRLWPHRNARGFPELLEASAHRTKTELELLLAERFPRPDVPCVVEPLAMSAPCQKLVPEPVVQTHVALGSLSSSCATTSTTESAGDAPCADTGRIGASSPPARVQPLAPQRYALQVTVSQATHDKLRRAQELLGHRVPARDLEQVLDRALDALIRQLEHTKLRRPGSLATLGSARPPASGTSRRRSSAPFTSATAVAARS